jgi:hypothetical protein
MQNKFFGIHLMPENKEIRPLSYRFLTQMNRRIWKTKIILGKLSWCGTNHFRFTEGGIGQIIGKMKNI